MRAKPLLRDQFDESRADQSAVSPGYGIKRLFGRGRTSERRGEPDGDRFEEMVLRLKDHPRFEDRRSQQAPYGLFHGRAIIGEESPVCGGIYVSLEPREAIVVDERYGMLKQVYSQFMVRYVKKYGERPKENIEHELIRDIIQFCQEKLRYIPEDGVAALLGRKEPDHKVALDVFLDRERGTDRHQMLLAAYLIEKLIGKEMLKGRAFLDSRCYSNRSTPERLIYSSANGYLLIFTPVAEFSQSGREEI